MAVFLGQDKISVLQQRISYVQVPAGESLPDINSNNSVTVLKEEWEDLEDAVKKRTGTFSTNNFSAADMIDELNSDYNVNVKPEIGVNGLVSETWTRPNDWPNLDSLNLSFSGENDFIYMTYRVGHADDYFGCNIKTVSGTATIDFGHISNGSYIIDSTRTAGSTSGANFFYFFNNETAGYTVIRITGKLSWVLLINATSTNGTPDSRELNQFQQPMLERIAYVPNITKFYDSSRYWGTYSLAREKIDNNTGTACTTVQGMYYYCQNLQDLDVSGFYTPNVTSLSETFRECYSLKVIDIAHWVVNKVTTMYCTFCNCRSVKELNFASWNTVALTRVDAAFQNCISLKYIYGLKNFANTSNFTVIGSVLYGCRSLENADDICNWNITSKVKSLSAVFYYCEKVKQLDISNWDITAVTNVSSMFAYCFNLQNIKFPTEQQTANLTTINSIFLSCYNLQNIDVTWLKMSAGTCVSVANAFMGCRSITELNIPSNWNLSAINNSNYSHYQIFYGCHSLKKITGITNWDFRSSTGQSASSMFYDCWSLKDLDISGWQLNSTSYASFFSNCYSLESVNISGFNTVNCTTLASMFYNCQSLKSITYPSTWNTSKITTVASMFAGCYSLKEVNIDFSTWDVSKITTLASMFANCWSLKTISITNWTLSACTTMATMFQNDYNLEKITWSGWSLPKLTSTSPGELLINTINLKEMVGFPPIKLAFSMRGATNFPADQFVTLFNNLQNTGGTARTLNMSTVNINKLTTVEKAIATGKGWTLAN